MVKIGVSISRNPLASKKALILRIAAEIGFNAMVVRDAGDSNEFGSPSHWVLLSKDSKVFGSVAFAGTNSELPDVRFAPLCTPAALWI